jgi:hypothetical protein
LPLQNEWGRWVNGVVGSAGVILRETKIDYWRVTKKTFLSQDLSDFGRFPNATGAVMGAGSLQPCNWRVPYTSIFFPPLIGGPFV